MNTIKKIEAEWVGISDAATMLSLHRSTIWKLIGEKRLEAKKYSSSKTIVSVASIRRLPETLPDAKAGPPKPHRQKADAPPRRRGRPRKQLEAIAPAVS
jgi:hypothetical protein